MTKKLITQSVPSTPSIPANRFNPPTMFPESGTAPSLACVPSQFAMHELLPHNQKLVSFVRKHQPISLASLFDLYPDVGSSFYDFGKRVTYLAGKHWVIRAGKGKDAVLTFNAARTPPAKVARPAAAASPAPDLSRLVAPSQINKMTSVYRPAPCAPQRPGSDDHTRLPSLHHGSRIPFVPGYIHL